MSWIEQINADVTLSPAAKAVARGFMKYTLPIGSYAIVADKNLSWTCGLDLDTVRQAREELEGRRYVQRLFSGSGPPKYKLLGN